MILSSFQSKQRTIKNSVSCQGVGVHGGKPSVMTFHKAPENTGIVFVRGDHKLCESHFIKAHVDSVIDTSFCTTIQGQKGGAVRTIEHVMAAIKGSGISNMIIEVSAEEVPIMDGSAAPFVEMIEKSGTCIQHAALPSLRVLKPVSVTYGDAKAMLVPDDHFSLHMTFNAGRRLNNLTWTYDFDPSSDHFKKHIAAARTFGFFEDAQKMWDAGLAQGSSLENTIVFQDGAVMNDSGLRFEDELVRHKLLDGIGDLALLGYPIIGKFVGINSGHTLHYNLMKALFSNTDNYTLAYSSKKIAHPHTLCAPSPVPLGAALAG